MSFTKEDDTWKRVPKIVLVEFVELFNISSSNDMFHANPDLELLPCQVGGQAGKDEGA